MGTRVATSSTTRESTLNGDDGESAYIIATGVDSDYIFNDGNDTIIGGAGDDLLYTGSGNDYIQGGYGNDTIHCGPGTNQIDGGPDTDTAIFTGNYANYDLDFANGVTIVAGIEGTSSLINIETIRFNDGSYDVLTGLFMT